MFLRTAVEMMARYRLEILCDMCPSQLLTAYESLMCSSGDWHTGFVESVAQKVADVAPEPVATMAGAAAGSAATDSAPKSTETTGATAGSAPKAADEAPKKAAAQPTAAAQVDFSSVLCLEVSVNCRPFT